MQWKDSHYSWSGSLIMHLNVEGNLLTVRSVRYLMKPHLIYDFFEIFVTLAQDRSLKSWNDETMPSGLPVSLLTVGINIWLRKYNKSEGEERVLLESTWVEIW